jgi:hypothetical protein
MVFISGPFEFESLRDDYLNRGLAPEGELFSFASPKESNQRKGDPIAAKAPVLLAFDGADRRGFLPLDRRTSSMKRPFGLFPSKAPVLGAANGT